MANIGDVVYLNSGGPAMTVLNIFKAGDVSQVALGWVVGGVMQQISLPEAAVSASDQTPAIAAAEAAAVSAAEIAAPSQAQQLTG